MFEQTDSATLVDLSTHYDLTESVQFYALAQNLLDEDPPPRASAAGARLSISRFFIWVSVSFSF